MPSYEASTRAEELRSYFTLIEQLGAPIEQLDDPVWRRRSHFVACRNPERRCRRDRRASPHDDGTVVPFLGSSKIPKFKPMGFIAPSYVFQPDPLRFSCALPGLMRLHAPGLIRIRRPYEGVRVLTCATYDSAPNASRSP